MYTMAWASNLLSKLATLAIVQEVFTNRKAVVKRYPPENEREENKDSEPRSLINFSSVGTSDMLEDSLHSNGEKKLKDASLPNKMVEYNEIDSILMNLKELAPSHESDATEIGFGMEAQADYDADTEQEPHEKTMMALENQYPTIMTELHEGAEKLKAWNQEQTRKRENVEKWLSQIEISYRLEERDTMLKFPKATLNESILLVGGYDGGQPRSSALNAFSPSRDVLSALKPMPTARGGTSVARFNSDLYVFGGLGIGSTFINTVESYNFENDEWTARPPMATKRCCLAGAALNEKLFAVGGRNEAEDLSSMEMFDPRLGSWIPARSMRHRRFCPGSVELNGALYVTGGYDGHDYLRSAERFDPREHSWSIIRSMNRRRRGHSLVTMNEKIYAIGGCDERGMKIPNVEIYEPRVGTWMSELPLTEGRAYFSAAVVDKTIYVIGGYDEDEAPLEMIECYKEGEGWRETNLRAVGKLCFASAIARKENEFFLFDRCMENELI